MEAVLPITRVMRRGKAASGNQGGLRRFWARSFALPIGSTGDVYSMSTNQNHQERYRHSNPPRKRGAF